MDDLLRDIATTCTEGCDTAHWEARLEGLTADATRTLLVEAIKHWCADPLSAARGARELATLLVHRGANPLATDQPALSWALCAEHPDIAMHLVNILCKAQSLHGVMHRTDDGGNALHLLLSYAPEWLGNALESSFNKTRFTVPPNRSMSLPPYAYLHHGWLAEQRADGATPLHVWWGQSIHDRDIHDPEMYPPIPEARNFLVWDATAYLLRAGAPLDAVDHAGKSVACLMVEAVEGGHVATDADWMPRAFAVHQQVQLQASTSDTPAQRPKARL